MQIDVRSDVKKLKKELNRVQRKQVPFATALALTKTAQDAKDELQREMKKVFNKPTRWTINSIFIKPATKKNLKAEISHKDFAPKGTPADKYLQPHIKGGDRGVKRLEKLLRNKGFLSSSEYIMPGQAVRLNKFGNVSKGMIQRILANLGANLDPYQKTKEGNRKPYFVAVIKGTKGVWLRSTKGPRPVLIAVKKRPTYRKRYKYRATINKTVDRVFRTRFERAFNRAQLKAR